MMRQTLQPSLIAGGSGRTILIAGGERGVIYHDGIGVGLSLAVWRKAQQYGVWKEVQQWAKEHPLAVKWLNQDTDMIHSIADTGWTRWCKSDGYASIKTNIEGSADIEAETSFVIYSIEPWYPPFGLWDGDKEKGNVIVRPHSSNGYLQWCSGAQWSNGGSGTTQGRFVVGQHHIVKQNMSAAYVDGTKVFTFNSSNYVKPSTPKYFTYFTVFGGKNPIVRISYTTIRRSGNVSNHLIPCVSNGSVGMVDVISGTFYPNANTTGSFTIELTPNQ